MIGQMIDGRYQIESLIGRGGMATVYQAMDLKNDRLVALKVLHMDLGLDTAPTRFYREFRVLTRLNHPHIMKAYGYSKHKKNPYLVLELLPGQTLREKLHDGPLPREQLLHIGRQIADALIHLHKRNIVHRDLKPSNLMLLPSKSIPHVKLMDFGLVRLNEQSIQLTQEGSTLGTFAYMSPEQAQGFPVDFQADLYSLGIILYEMAVGRPPFVHENQATVLLQQITTLPLPPHHYNPDLDEPLSQFILELLQKSPEDRPSSTQLVVKQLANLLDETAELVTIPSSSLALNAKMPLIGREAHMSTLTHLWHQVQQEQGRVVLIQGAVGMGKGRLLTEFKRNSRISKQQFLRDRNQEHGSLPYQPFINFLEELIKHLPDAVQSTLSPELRRLLPQFSDLPSMNIRSDKTNSERIRLFGACWDALQKAVTIKPRVIVVEELQWANPITLELINYLMQRLQEVPLLFIFTYRPDEIKGISPLATLLRDFERNTIVSTIELTPFSQEQVNTYLSIALGSENIPDWLIEQFYLTTGGNPLFIEETLKLLAAEEQLSKWQEFDSNHSFTFNNKLSQALQLPQSVLDLAKRRLHTIPDEQKNILTTAAVLGSEFNFDLLQAVTRTEEEELIDAVDWFIDNQFIEELPMRAGEDRYRFREEYMRQSLLDDASRRRLRLLHRRSGEALRELYDTSRPRYWPVLAYHYAEAGKYEEAITYFSRAGDASTKMYAHTEAVANYNAAIGLSDKHPLTETQIQHLYHQRGRNLELEAQFEAALNSYEILAKLAEERESDVLTLTSLISRATIYATPTPFQDTKRGHQLSQEGLALARKLGNREVEAKALWNLLLSLFHDKPYEAIIYGEESVAIARELNLKEQLAFTLNDLHWPYMETGQMKKAKVAWEEAQSLWRELNNKPMLADSQTNAARALLISGELEEAYQMAEAAYRVSQAIDNLWGQAYSRWPVENYWLEKGEPDKALDCMENALEVAEQIDLIPPQVMIVADMAGMFASLGDYDRALEIAQLAQNTAKSKLPWAQPYADAFLARAHLLAGAIDEASAILATHQQKAIENVMAPGSVWLLLTQTAVLIDQTKYAEALEILAHLQDSFTQAQVRLYLPDVFNLRGDAFYAQGIIDEAELAWTAAYDEAAAIGSRRNMWPALVGLYRIAVVRGHEAKAASLRQQAKAVIDHIAEHADKINLRQTFLKHPLIQAIS